jgi:hypothetical protein
VPGATSPTPVFRDHFTGTTDGVHGARLNTATWVDREPAPVSGLPGRSR